MSKKSEFEKYIKAVRQEILNNGMEIVPVRMMLDEHMDTIFEEFYKECEIPTPYKTAKKILKYY